MPVIARSSGLMLRPNGSVSMNGISRTGSASPSSSALGAASAGPELATVGDENALPSPGSAAAAVGAVGETASEAALACCARRTTSLRGLSAAAPSALATPSASRPVSRAAFRLTSASPGARRPRRGDASPRSSTSTSPLGASARLTPSRPSGSSIATSVADEADVAHAGGVYATGVNAGLTKLTTSEPAPAASRAWRRAINSSYDAVATPLTVTMRERGDTPSRSAWAPGTRPFTTSVSGSMFMPSGSDRLNETSVVGSPSSAGGGAGSAAGDEDSSKRRIKTGAPSSSFAWRCARKASYEVTGVLSTATILAPGGTP